MFALEKDKENCFRDFGNKERLKALISFYQ